ncbi:MAG: 30S ribosomal protein S20 [Planctomycetales bacterium]|nr:30S ribosomal protein S20 [Planctomycetales bacterium]NIM09429.1 30S ribosomal protein S20 [Planctomycetales bacterium]NIN08907.1 30S ribosomal protein S20 [Planctomycetales bacterium]NIN78022.1 30S ribosomal protein S20 [Planctomycetales bacterium]NIO35210.1 30S ribosomal protein S20 [Planctomycetales bacterium]
MPNSKSAKKRLRQNETHRQRNRSTKSTLRSHLRKVTQAVEAGDVAASEAAFRLAAEKLDRAAARHLIHANAAARTKSRLSAKIKALKA